MHSISLVKDYFCLIKFLAKPSASLCCLVHFIISRRGRHGNQWSWGVLLNRCHS